MGKTIVLKISEVRNKITQLDKLIKPGEVLQITKRGKPYAHIKLIQEEDPYEAVLTIVDSLPDNNGNYQRVAENYKDILYGLKVTEKKKI